MNAAERVSELLGIDAAEWSGPELEQAVNFLPLFLSGLYDLSGVEIAGERMIVARPVDNERPEALVRHMELISQHAGCPAVLSIDETTPYLRRKLVSTRTGFVTANGQAFIPGLLRLAPQTKTAPQTKRAFMSPSAKQAFVCLMLHAREDVTVADLVAATGMSRSSGKRALEEVRAAAPLSRGLAGPKSRTAVYRARDPQGLAYSGSAAFGPAVRERFLVPVDAAEGLPLCGRSALAECSLLSPPSPREVACAPGDAAQLREFAVEGRDGSVEVAVLTYDPMPFVDAGRVDLCTMALTVDREDERINSCLEEAVEKEMPWLTSIR